MLFNSFAFAGFFVLVFTVTLRLGHRGQNLWLLAASYAFYAAWDWRFLSLVLVSTAVDYLAGARIHAASDRRRRRVWLTLSVAVNLGLLATFKYFDFFADNLARLAGLAGVELGPVTLGLVLPVGISFYTFQTMSYSIDIYRGRMEPARHLPDFALFVAFFPQLLAGPIERARHLLPQIQRRRRIGLEDVSTGAHLIFWGLVQKVFVADNLSRLVDGIYGAGQHDTAAVIVGTYAFVFQVFCDFAGYSNIARGLGRMLGFDITVNFRAPLVMADVTELWRRWHISLATWFRDYLFRPLVRSRRLGPDAALLLTWTLIGLWHGAAWHFVAFGTFTGAVLVGHRLLRRRLRLGGPPGVRYALGVALTFNLAAGSAFLFRVEDGERALAMLAALLRGPWASPALPAQLGTLAFFAAPVVAVQIGQAVYRDPVWLLSARRWIRVAAYVVGFYLLLWFGQTGGRAFIYYQF